MADTENNKNSNSPASTSAPALRFPGFTEPWRRIRLGDNCTIQMCKRIFANQTSEIGEVPFFKIGTIGGYPDTFISKELFEEYKTRYNYPSEGEVMITCAGTVGKTMQFDGIDSYFQDSNIVWIHNPNQLTVNDFLAYVLGKINWNKLNSTTITRIYNDDLRNLIYFAPENVAEQRKIVSLLRLIDERIATQRRLIEKLKTLIKGIAEFLTTNTPNTKIADCLVCHSSTLQENQVGSSGKYRVYGASGICGYTDLPEVTDDSILIVKDGSGVGSVTYANRKYSVIGTSNYLTAKNGYLLRYLYYCLMCFNFTPYKTGMAIPHIYFKDYRKAKIYCPSIEEQRKIAAALSDIEVKIEIEQTILQQYTIQKQYLLQQLFI